MALSFIWTGYAVRFEDYGLLLPGLIVWGAAQPGLFSPPRRAIMNTVPNEKQGQVRGIVMTAQRMGGTIGMAACSSLLLATGDYGLVFVVSSVVAAIIFVVGFFAIERATPHPSQALS